MDAFAPLGMSRGDRERLLQGVRQAGANLQNPFP